MNNLIEQSMQNTLSVTPHEGLPKTIRTKRPDREARSVLRLANLVPKTSSKSVPLPLVRKICDVSMSAMGTHPKMHKELNMFVTGIDNNQIPIRIYYPTNSVENTPALLWSFGGGFVIGSIETGGSICRNIAKNTGCIVVAVQYRLVPENTLLDGRNDCNSVLEWMKTEGNNYGIDSKRLAVGGDSAGGNISACLAQKHKDLCLQLLVYPATTFSCVYLSYQENIKGYLLDEEAMDMLGEAITIGAQGIDVNDPWISPANADSFKGLPPAIIVTCGYDPIRDQGLDYSSKLRNADVPTQLLHYAGQFHGFINCDSIDSAARDFMIRASVALVKAFDGWYEENTIEIADGIGSTTSYNSFSGEVVSEVLTIWESVAKWRQKLTPKFLKPFTKPWDIATHNIRSIIERSMDKLESVETY